MAPIEAENTVTREKISSKDLQGSKRILTSRSKVHVLSTDEGGRLLVTNRAGHTAIKSVQISVAEGVGLVLHSPGQLSIDMEGNHEIKIDDWKFTSSDKTQGVKEG